MENLVAENAPEAQVVKPIENLDFLKNIPLTMGEKPKAEVIITEKKETPATENTTPEIKEDSGKTQGASEVIQNEALQEFEVTPEDLGSFLKEETQGFINDVSELHAIIDTNRQLQERIKELEDNPIGIIKDPKAASIAKFLMDYKGGDFHTGIQTYAKLQSLDIANLKAEDALRETYIMDKAQAGISRTDAEEMFKVEFDKKYGEYGELAEKFMNADAFDAKKKLEDAKKAFTIEQPKDDGQAAQKEQAFREAREQFEQQTKKSLTGFDSLILDDLTDNPEDNFVFKIENVDQIANAMHDYQGWFNGRYISDEGFNTEQMKQDQALIHNFEKISQTLFEHGRFRGKEEAIKERQNIPNKNNAAESNFPGKGSIPETMEQALLKAIKIQR